MVHSQFRGKIGVGSTSVNYLLHMPNPMIYVQSRGKIVVRNVNLLHMPNIMIDGQSGGKIDVKNVNYLLHMPNTMIDGQSKSNIVVGNFSYPILSIVHKIVHMVF